MDEDEKAPTWTEETDPTSGGTFWKNSITGEISLEDPSNRAKSNMIFPILSILFLCLIFLSLKAWQR